MRFRTKDETSAPQLKHLSIHRALKVRAQILSVHVKPSELVSICERPERRGYQISTPPWRDVCNNILLAVLTELLLPDWATRPRRQDIFPPGQWFSTNALLRRTKLLIAIETRRARRSVSTDVCMPWCKFSRCLKPFIRTHARECSTLYSQNISDLNSCVGWLLHPICFATSSIFCS